MSALPQPLREALRLSVIPFLATLFPAVHYVSRNLGTEVLFPHVAPSTRLTLFGIAVGLGGSLAVGVTFGAVLRAALVTPESSENPAVATRDEPLLWRTLLPTDRALAVLAVLLVPVVAYGVTAVAGVGPDGLGTAVAVLALPFGWPVLVFAPLSIAFHSAVVAGYVASALWTATLARLIADATA